MVRERKGAIARLGKLVAAHPGRTPMVINVNYGRVQIKIRPQQEGVDLNDEFYQGLKKMSSDEIHLRYK